MSDTQPDHILPPGTEAPEFTLASGPGRTLSLSQYRGQPVILCFYPADWSGTCSEQVVLYNELLSEFRRYDAQLLGISVDGVWCHKAFAEARNLRFPLLADFEPKGAVARQYGVYRTENGISERALFVIDPAGVIRWSYLSPIGSNPGAEGILQALEQIDNDTSSAHGEVSSAGNDAQADASPADEQASNTPTSEPSQSYARGSENATVVLLEYLDFECPDCRNAYDVLNEIPADVMSNVRHEVRNFPLRESHPHAQHAAEAALAAGAQGKYWDMYEQLFQHQDALEDDNLVEYARAIGLDEERFRNDLSTHAFADAVEQERLEGARAGVNGTPTFFIDGTRYEGAGDAASLADALRR